MSSPRPSPGAANGSEPVAILLSPGDLSTSPRQVCRYAGGNRYQPDAARRALVQAAIAHAGQLITPALVYALHPVTSRLTDGTVTLHNGLALHLPLNAGPQDAGYVAAIVCTLGPALEEACRQLHRQGKVLEALFLDAAGVALLEAVGDRAYELLEHRAREDNLVAGCRCAPGYGSMPITQQALLFRLVDAGAIGVQLNRHLVMRPCKSLSFFSSLTRAGSSPRQAYKCQSCSLKDCRFRRQPGEKSENCGPPSG